MSELTSRGEMLLFNPYHDRLGRFTTKHGSFGAVPAIGVVDGDKLKKESEPYKPIVHSGRDHEISVTARYENSRGFEPDTLIERKLLSPVASFFAKKGMVGALSRFGMDAALDMGLYFLAGATVCKGASILGAAAGAALFGGTLAPLLLGVGAGLAARYVWMRVTEPHTDALFYGFMDKYSIRDKNHKVFGMTGADVTARKRKSRAIQGAWALGATPPWVMLGELAGSVALGGFSANFHKMPSGLIYAGIKTAVGANPLGLQDPREAIIEEASGDEKEVPWMALNTMVPMVNNVALGLTRELTIPVGPFSDGLGDMGWFKDEDSGLYRLRQDDALQFIDNITRDDIKLKGNLLF